MQTQSPAGGPSGHSEFSSIEHAIDHASHLLPSQGPIAVFVHHNTLHALEEHTLRRQLTRRWPFLTRSPISLKPDIAKR